MNRKRKWKCSEHMCVSISCSSAYKFD
jgi:hypothetical protein